MRGPRDVFQRDRDRIIHSIAFRRLRHKTQVFISPDGDHYRVRLTHSLEVAQIGRTIARALGLNEDLTEALCLAHDIGHPPFGHAGEAALEEALCAHGGFDHNAHTIRVLAVLESPYPRWNGLNLSWELLEGLAKHNGPVADPPWALAQINARFDLELHRWASLEAQVAAIADDIAYDNHDIDDGLRAGILTMDQLLTLPFIAERWDDIRREFSDVAPDRLVAELVRQQIGAMVNDVIDQTRANIAASGIASIADLRGADRAMVAFSPEMRSWISPKWGSGYEWATQTAQWHQAVCERPTLLQPCFRVASCRRLAASPSHSRQAAAANAAAAALRPRRATCVSTAAFPRLPRQHVPSFA